MITGDGCIWRGTSPFCNGGCDVLGHVVRETSSSGDGEKCWTGIKVLCCPAASQLYDRKNTQWHSILRKKKECSFQLLCTYRLVYNYFSHFEMFLFFLIKLLFFGPSNKFQDQPIPNRRISFFFNQEQLTQNETFWRAQQKKNIFESSPTDRTGQAE